MIILQALVNGLVSGTLLAVPAIGFTAMFAVLRFPNFSVSRRGDARRLRGLPRLWRGPADGGLAGRRLRRGGRGRPAAFDKVAHLPLVKQGALPAAIASIATGLVLENVVRLGFGNEPRGYDRPIARECASATSASARSSSRPWRWRSRMMLAVFAALAFTRIGKAMRASADNPELAALKGIRPERIAMMASFVGMGLVGVGGMLLGLDSSIDPLTGTRILLSIFAAAVLGGLGSAPGAVLGAFLIGIAEELSVLVVGSQYRAAVGFVAILMVLTLRPRGLLGERAF